MAVILFWVAVAVVAVHLCSLVETILYSVRTSTLVARRLAGSKGAARLLEIKQTRMDDAIVAILIVNTLAATFGSTLAGAQAARVFGEPYVGVLSAAMTVLLLLFSEILPKTMAARYAGGLSAFAGNALYVLVRLMAPLLFGARALIGLLARRPRERLTRREFAIAVDRAPREGAISLAEAQLIGSLIYSRELTLRDVMTPVSAIFAMNGDQTVGNLINARGADAFSRIPLFGPDGRRFIGYVSHREVLKAFAADRDANRNRALRSFLRQIPVFAESVHVPKALEQLLVRRESIALVVGKPRAVVGLVTLEDLLEAVLGLEITDEAEAITRLRPEVTAARKSRAQQLRQERARRKAPND
ncbi:MAG: DUF21 domain-containing protein [Betaproteobacteria bacterium]|nr:MAG: DUF21 domain-containing protein [Betaproteobacteria bacterium]